MYRYVIDELDYALKLNNSFGYKTMIFNVTLMLTSLAYAVRLELMA